MFWLCELVTNTLGVVLAVCMPKSVHVVLTIDAYSQNNGTVCCSCFTQHVINHVTWNLWTSYFDVHMVVNTYCYVVLVSQSQQHFLMDGLCFRFSCIVLLSYTVCSVCLRTYFRDTLLWSFMAVWVVHDTAFMWTAFAIDYVYNFIAPLETLSVVRV
jgi:hypothetical protein